MTRQAVIVIVAVVAVATILGTTSLINLSGTPHPPAATTGQLGQWVQTTAYPLNMTSPSCAAGGGYLYCVGGYSGSTTNSAYFSSLSSSGVGPWQPTTSYPIEIQDEECMITAGYIYCVGGVIGGQEGLENDSLGRTGDVYYAPVSSSGIGTWMKTTPFPHIDPSPRCMISYGYIYCVSAKLNGTGSGFTDVPDAYFAELSPSGVGTWSQTTAPPTETAGCSAINGYAYCFGGAGCPPIPGDCYSPTYFAPLSPSGIGAWKSTFELPTAGYAVYTTAESYIYYLSTPVYVTSASSNGISSWGTTTNYPAYSYPGTCVSDGDYIYCVGGAGEINQPTNSVYYAEVGASNPNALQLVNPPPFPRAEYLAPAWTEQGGCSASGPGYFAGAPCFSYDIDNAVIFNCAAAASTSAGCKTTVVSPLNRSYNYNLTIWYPYTNASFPDTNCRYAASPGGNGAGYGWCISVGQNSFIIAQQVELQGGTGANGLVIHVVNDTSGVPVAGIRVLAGPASSKSDIAFTPGGPTVKECVHDVPSGSSVLANGTVIFPNGTAETYPACPLVTYTTNSSGWVSIPEAAGTYYFFNVGGMASANNVYGIVQLSQSAETRVTVNWPNGNYTVTTTE